MGDCMRSGKTVTIEHVHADVEPIGKPNGNL